MTPEASPTRGRADLLDATIGHFAEHGVSNQSLRGLATAIGTSHRMLLYHFGSREGLLVAVVEAVEGQQREALARMASADDDASPRELALRFWAHVVGPTLRYGPLFFELAAHAMQGQSHAQALRVGLIDPWLEPLAELMERAGHPPTHARARARLGLAVARGLLFDLLLTGDRSAVDAAMVTFVELVESTADPDAPPASGAVEGRAS